MLATRKNSANASAESIHLYVGKLKLLLLRLFFFYLIHNITT